jgi:hypothetical protein
MFWSFGDWSFEFVWDLELRIWDFGRFGRMTEPVDAIRMGEILQ